MTTKAKKRVELAKEVLLQFKLGKMVSTRQVYFMPVYEGPSVTKVVACNVCAVGALAVACCGMTIPNSQYAIIDCLKPYFSIPQLALIEAALEQTSQRYVTDGLNIRISMRSLEAAAKKYPFVGLPAGSADWEKNRTERLQKIMRNIVRNKGTFVV